MRRLLAAFLLIASASLARAGVLVEFTDGTKLTVESHWSDGQQVHLLRGGVDMIVAKSRIKSMNDDVKDPEVYSSGPDQEALEDAAPGDAPVAAAAASDAPIKADSSLEAMSEAELEAMQAEESGRLLELQDKRFNAMAGGKATAQEQQQAEEAFERQSQRTAHVRKALDNAKKIEGVPTVPPVEQPQ